MPHLCRPRRILSHITWNKNPRSGQRILHLEFATVAQRCQSGHGHKNRHTRPSPVLRRQNAETHAVAILPDPGEVNETQCGPVPTRKNQKASHILSGLAVAWSVSGFHAWDGWHYTGFTRKTVAAETGGTFHSGYFFPFAWSTAVFSTGSLTTDKVRSNSWSPIFRRT
jgi:hypothetical protein